MRKWTPYELTQLLKYNLDPQSVNESEDKPVEYITGFAPFYGRDFKVVHEIAQSCTLIPRYETEIMIDIALQFSDQFEEDTLRFADIGTGCGSIGLTVALELEKRNLKYQGILTDISEEAIQIAKANCKQLMANYLHTKQSDLLSNIDKTNKFNLILANLPYVPSTRLHKLDSSVKDYEPMQALDGGDDGLNLFRKLLNQLPNYLADNHLVILEVDDTHNDTSEFAKNWDIEIQEDENGKTRFWLCYNTK